MVARVLFPVLTYRENASTPPPPGDHQGPPFPASSTLAPTDYPASCLASRLRLMLIGCPKGIPWQNGYAHLPGLLTAWDRCRILQRCPSCRT